MSDPTGPELLANLMAELDPRMTASAQIGNLLLENPDGLNQVELLGAIVGSMIILERKLIALEDRLDSQGA